MTRRVSSGMITRRLLFAAAVPAFAAPSGAATTTARANDSPKKKPFVFDATFPTPTGANRYEELILAGEKLSEAEKYYSGADHFPLSKKREYLARPASRDALRLLQVGIAKPLAYPKRLPQGNVFAAFGRLRALARLIAVSMYVSCVDGRTDNAVRLAGDALTFSYPMKSMSLIGSLVGLAVDAIALSSDQVARFSECTRLPVSDPPDGAVARDAGRRCPGVVSRERKRDEKGRRMARKMGRNVRRADATVRTIRRRSGDAEIPGGFGVGRPAPYQPQRSRAGAERTERRG